MLESGMNYLGLSGVEDLLQEEVRETIESLREARIRIWILTGDKVETAKCIAKSTGLKAKNEIFYEMLSHDALEIEN
jgi:phospholipid-translocating ATPase